MNGREETNQKFSKKAMKLAEALTPEVEEYVKQELVTKQPKTVFTYTQYINTFLTQYYAERFLSGNDRRKYSEITTEILRKYFQELNLKTNSKGEKETVSASYYRVTWYALHSLFDYLVETGHIEENPMENVEKRRRGRRVKKYNYLEEQQVQRLLEIIREPYENRFSHDGIDPLAIRDMVIIELYLQTGMRLSALTQIKMSDVNLEKQEIYVIDKGDKVFVHSLPDKFMEHLQYYIEQTRRWMMNCCFVESEYLFFAHHSGRQLAPTTVYDIVSKYTEMAGNKVGPHKLRATYALMLYDKTKDSILVQHKMGHQSVNTTMLYINHVSDEKKAQADKIIEDVLF